MSVYFHDFCHLTVIRMLEKVRMKGKPVVRFESADCALIWLDRIVTTAMQVIQCTILKHHSTGADEQLLSLA